MRSDNKSTPIVKGVHVYIHDNSWKGCNLLIFGKTPVLPMKIEQTISNALPYLEERLHSFEDYEQAFDHCKESKKINLLIIEIANYDINIDQIVQNFSYHYEKLGFPCGLVFFHNDNPNVEILRYSIQNKKCIKTIHIKDLLDTSKIKTVFSELWTNYVPTVKNILFPEDVDILLRNYILNTNHNFASSLATKEKLYTLISSNLNISWMQDLVTRDFFVIDQVKKLDDRLLSTLGGYCSLIQDHFNLDFNTINPKDKRFTLEQRVVKLIEDIECNRTRNSVGYYLESFCDSKNRRKGALEKIISNNLNDILRITPCLR